MKAEGPEAGDFSDVLETAPQLPCWDYPALEGLIAVIIGLIGRISKFQGQLMDPFLNFGYGISCSQMV